jgi:hypothetical protein
MRMLGNDRFRISKRCHGSGWIVMMVLTVCFAAMESVATGQDLSQQALAEKVERLSTALASTQAQLEQSQQQLEDMRKELSSLKQQLANSAAASPSSSEPVNRPSISSQGTPEDLAAAVQDIRERQAVVESQIATHDQTKVESESKYPVKITGLLLMNGFVDTGAVDIAATPTVALQGDGSVGATVRQTVLGIDARGPHLFGANSYADLRMDFAGNSFINASTSNSPGYGNSYSTFIRMRTLHAGLDWSHAEAFFSLDHPILSPDSPTSLVAVAQPALAWSGNLWAWNPQAGITYNIGQPGSRNLQLQAALIDAGDAPLTPGYANLAEVPPNSAEESSRPGVEARIAFLGSEQREERSHIGVGGYFATHRTALGRSFDSWAATLDARFLLRGGLQFSGSFYRGLGLGGLGAGTYKDFVYKPNPNTGGYYFQALNDVGGWAQLKERVNERLEFNGAFGMDNAFASQMRRYIVYGGTMFQNLTINRTFTANTIYSPSAYLLFSLEYRHIESSPIVGLPARSNILGLGAGYKF